MRAALLCANMLVCLCLLAFIVRIHLLKSHCWRSFFGIFYCVQAVCSCCQYMRPIGRGSQVSAASVPLARVKHCNVSFNMMFYALWFLGGSSILHPTQFL